MANAKFRCLLAVRDDLHDFAETVHARMREYAVMPAFFPREYGTVKTGLVGRASPYQIELVSVLPGTVIPPHRHPDVDSIDILVSGDILIDVDGVTIAADYSSERRAEFLYGKGLRISSDAMHGGIAGNQGAFFLSCQRWKTPPLSSIGLSWVGPRVTTLHDQLLDCLRGAA